MTTLAISSSYRSAVWTAVLLQVLSTILLGLILDGGVIARIGVCATAGFWVGAAVVILRRPQSPTRLDLLYLRWGYVPMLIAALLLGAAYIGFRISSSI